MVIEFHYNETTNLQTQNMKLIRYLQNYFSLITILLLTLPAYSQIESLYPDTEGDALLDSLIKDFKTLNVLDYDEARDFMYGELDNHNDTVRGIYSNHAIYLPPNVDDPSTFLFMNGSRDGINAEHVYPQSKGAREGNARSDMHHLFPARAAVNSARGNRFLGEVDDNLTAEWFWQDMQQSEIPTENIDEWSERATQVFEPREKVKGDVARAVFYFYTMYKEQADEADDFFFDVQREDLCQWHSRDPVDIDELIRSQSVAIFQDDKANPFVLDCTLASRTYCSDILVGCDELTVSVEDQTLELLQLTVFPNPSYGQVNVKYQLQEKSNVELTVYDMVGRVVRRVTASSKVGHNQESLNMEKGFYLLGLTHRTNNSITKTVQKIVIQ